MKKSQNSHEDENVVWDSHGSVAVFYLHGAPAPRNEYIVHFFQKQNFGCAMNYCGKTNRAPTSIKPENLGDGWGWKSRGWVEMRHNFCPYRMQDTIPLYTALLQLSNNMRQPADMTYCSSRS